jgi:hypothetical protein
MAKGDRGIRRFYVPLSRTREEILERTKKWFSGFNKASDLKTTAQFTEVFPVYVPFWRVNGAVVGWVLGDEKKGSGKDTKYEPVERRVNQKYEYTCPACDVGEFGVKWVDLKGDEILPFDLEEVQRQGMNFEVMTTPTDVLRLCEEEFIKWGESSAKVDRKTFSKLHLINRTFSLVYYPLWIVRYTYKNRIYQVTADAESSDLLFGRAPGNNMYRVFCLMASISIAMFVMTSSLKSADDTPAALIIVCILAMLFGFWKFRYGGEVKLEQSDRVGQKDFWNLVQKAKLARQDLQSIDLKSLIGKVS